MASAIRVLYVDDDPSFAEVVAEFLEREDDRLEVVFETDATAALDRFRSAGDSIDCIVSDYEMPELDGLELLEAVRGVHGELPFVLFTGRGSEEIAGEAISAGVTDYLQKGGTEQYTVLANRIVNAVDQYRAARAAERSENRLRELAETANDALWMFADDFSELLFVNSTFEELYGVSTAELRDDPRAFLDAIHPGDRERAERAIRQLRAGQSVELEHRVNEAENYRRWVWVRAEPIVDEGGAVDRIVGSTREITERRERQRERRRNERRFEAVFEDPKMLVGLLDRDGTVLQVNHTAMEFVDVGVDAVIGDPFWETPWWTDEVRDDVRRWVDRAAAGEYVEYETDLVQPSGDQYSVDGTVRPVTDEEGDAVSLIVSARDVTEREKRKRELERQKERLEEFADVVSHDLRNPLNVAEGYLAAAREDCKNEHLADVARAHERMRTLIDELLTVARDGQDVGETERVDLAATARESWQNVATDAATIRIETARAISADRSRTQQLLENLFRNAVEHAGPDVTVTIGDLDGGFFVEDDGAGIPEARRPNVFESGYTTAADGTGFGLAIVEQIAQAHGWTLRIDESDDGGARFEIAAVDVVP